MTTHAFEFDDTPVGLRDADIEQASIEAAGRRLASLRRRGICSHGWIQGASGPCLNGEFDRSPVVCLDCGATFATGREWGRARDEALGR